MQPKHNSDSTTQTKVEKTVKAMLTKEGYIFYENLTEKLNYKLDLYGEIEGEIVIGEIYAGIDKILPAQKKKVVNDCFKLVYIEKVLKKDNPLLKIHKIIVFVDDKIKNSFLSSSDKSNSWVKDAIKEFSIDLIKIELNENQIDELRLAKARQKIGMTISNSKK